MKEKAATKRGFNTNTFLESAHRDSGKLPPQDIAMEMAVLGALMNFDDTFETVNNIITPETFYKEAHKFIYLGIVSLKANFEKVDLGSVVSQLRKEGVLEFVGGAQYVAKVYNGEYSINIEFNCRIILQAAIKRDMIHLAGDISRDAFEDTTDCLDLLDRSIDGLGKISQSIFRGLQKTNLSISKSLVNELGNKDTSNAISTGFDFLDKYLRLRRNKSKMIFIGARPSVGKSALIAAMAKNMAMSVPVGFVSLEMSSDDIFNRMVVSEMPDLYTNETFIPEDVPQEHLIAVQNAISKIMNLPIYYLDSAQSYEELENTILLWVAKYGIKVLFLDFIQKVKTEYKDKMHAVSFVSDNLQKLSKKIGIPFIIISSLNRNAEKNNGKPSMADLRGSGDIESDADVVLMLWRPESHDIDNLEIKVDDYHLNIRTKDVMVGEFCKNRNGKVGETFWKHHLASNNFFPYQEVERVPDHMPGTPFRKLPENNDPIYEF